VTAAAGCDSLLLFQIDDRIERIVKDGDARTRVARENAAIAFKAG
jgi:hypothetical protein